MGLVDGMANLLMAVVLIEPMFASNSSLEDTLIPDLRQSSVIREGKNRQPFGLNAQEDISC